jgi:protein ImuA
MSKSKVENITRTRYRSDMSTHLLPHRGTAAPDRPALALADDIALPYARLSEVCGPSRRAFAMWAAGRVTGPVIWIAPAWATERLDGPGVAAWIDPGRLLLVQPTRTEDLLWSMEESLRAGAVPLVVGDLPGLPGLTAVRRMHLAAETGAAEGAHRPIGLILTPGPGGAQGVETRWRMDPAHQNRLRRWTLSRLRARTRPPRDWTIAQDRPGAPLSPTGAEVQENVG